MRTELIVSGDGVREVQASTLRNPEQWFLEFVQGSSESDSGAKVNWKTTLGLSAVWYCVNRISNDIAQMELELYQSVDEQSEENESHPAGRLMRYGGTSPITAFHLRKLVQAHACLHGNGRAYVVRDRVRRPSDLIPLPHTSQTVTIYDTAIDQRSKWHVVYPEESQLYEPIPLPDDDVLHIFALSNDGYCGLSPLEILKNPFGLGMAAEKTGNKFFKNNAIPSLVLEAPPGVFRNEGDAQTFLQRFNERHAGLDNTGRAGLLREGIKASTLTMDFDKAQLMELREFQVREIMRAFGVPHIPGVTDSQSYNTLEQLNRAYLLHCLGPWLKAWTTECDRKLLAKAERESGSLWFEFDTWELVKPDAAQRAEMLGKLVTNMIITSNEARDWEGLPPLPGGDELRNPATTRQQEQRPPERDTQQQESMSSLFRPLLSEEIARVREMAAKARNFLDWLDSYYAKLQPRLSARVASCGGADWIAADWIESHKLQLLDVAGACQKEDLSEQVKIVTANWPEQITDLANTIIRTRA